MRQSPVEVVLELPRTAAAFGFRVDRQHVEPILLEERELEIVVVFVRHAVPPQSFVVGGERHGELEPGEFFPVHDGEEGGIAPAVAVVVEGEFQFQFQEPARTYIYNYPYANQFYAIAPGFAEGLLKLAQEVRDLASTNGEKARAEVLLRHFERLDCMAAFKGVAYMNPMSCELDSAEDAAKMLNDSADRADSLFAAWERVRRYFLESPDFDNPKAYGSRAAYDTIALLAESFGKASGYKDAPAVVAASRRIAALKNLPADVRQLLGTVFSCKAENFFSNPGFAKPIDAMRIKTTLPHEIVVLPESGKILRIWPGRPNGDPDPGDAVLRHVSAFTMTEDLKPGVYLAAVRVRSAARAATGDLVAWLQTDGADKNWEAMRPAALRKGEWHTFVQVRKVRDTEDGLNLKLRVSGFGKDDTLDIGDVRMLRLADAGPSGRTKSLSARGLTAREGTARETVRGENAIACRSDAYAFAHAIVDMSRILPEERLVFTLRAALPENAKTGQLGAMLFPPALLLGVAGYSNLSCWALKH